MNLQNIMLGGVACSCRVVASICASFCGLVAFIWAFIYRPSRLILVAIVVMLVAFFLRDAHPVNSAFTIGALLFAGLVHHLRQKSPQDPTNWGRILPVQINASTQWRFVLLVMEWLSIAIAGHFLVNNLLSDFDEPYKRLRDWCSCTSGLSNLVACYKTAYLP